MIAYEDEICPRIRKKIETLKLETRLWTVKSAGGNKSQVSNGEHVFVVSIVQRT